MKTTSATTLNHFKFLHQNYTSTRPQLDQTPGGVMLAPVYNPYSWPMSVGALPMGHCAYWGIRYIGHVSFPILNSNMEASEIKWVNPNDI